MQVRLSLSYVISPDGSAYVSLDTLDHDQLLSFMSLLNVTRISVIALASTFVSPEAGTVLTTTGGSALTETTSSSASLAFSGCSGASVSAAIISVGEPAAREGPANRVALQATMPRPSNNATATFSLLRNMARRTPRARE